jgi:hypothetical protein
MTPLVVAEEGDGFKAVEVAEEGMFKDDAGEARAPVLIAEGFELVALAVVVFDGNLFGRWIERLDRLGGADATDAAADEEPVGNQAIEQWNAPRRLRQLVLQLLHDALLDEAEVMHDLGDAPAAGRRTARELFRVERCDGVEQLAVHPVQLPVYSLHQLCSWAIIAAGCQ